MFTFYGKIIKIYSEGVNEEREKHEKIINSRVNGLCFMWM